MLAGNVVTTAIREASLARADRDDRGDRSRCSRGSSRSPSGWRRSAASAHADVVAQRADLAQARALAARPATQPRAGAAPPRRATRAGRRARRTCPNSGWPSCSFPSELPLSLPSELARQRPDIRAAEALLQRKPARRSASPPRISIRRSRSRRHAGSLATNAVDLFAAATRLLPARRIAGAADLPRRRAAGEAPLRGRGVRAGRRRPTRKSCSQGFQNVADMLRALEADADKLKERADAAAQARRLRADHVGALRSGRREPLRPARRATQARNARARPDAGRRRSLRRLRGAASRRWAAAGGTRKRRRGSACEVSGPMIYTGFIAQGSGNPFFR